MLTKCQWLIISIQRASFETSFAYQNKIKNKQNIYLPRFVKYKFDITKIQNNNKM